MSKITALKLIIILALLTGIPSSFSEPQTQAQKQFTTAAGAFSDQFYQAAHSLFQRFINDFPEDRLAPKANLYIAKCLYYQNDYSASLLHLKELKKQNYPDLDTGINYWIGKNLFKKNKFKESLEYLKKITEKKDLRYYSKAKYLSALSYLKINEKEKAKQKFQELTTVPSDLELQDNSYQNLLKLYQQEKNFNLIITTAEKYLEANPQTGIKDQIYFYLANSYRQKRQLEKAINYYRLALETTRNPNLRDRIYKNLGKTYLDQNKKALAKRTIDRISNNQLRLFSQSLYYFEIKEYIPALELVNSYLDRHPEGEFAAKAHLTKADILYETGRINDAASSYQTILEKFTKPEHNQIRNIAHYGLAWCYLRRGDFKKAIAEFRKTLDYIDIPEIKVSSKIQIADAYQESNKFQEALDVYNQILNDYPHTFYADYIQFQIGMIFLKEKNIEKSTLAFNNLIRNFPKSNLLPEAKYYIAVGYFSQEKYDQSYHQLMQLIEKYPNSKITLEAKYLSAKSLFNQQKYKQALTIFKKIITERKNIYLVELAHIDAGLTYLNLKEFDKAKNIYRDFLNSYPDSEHNSSVAIRLGGIYEMEQDYRQAEKYYSQALKNSKNTLSKQEALLSLGHLAWSRGQLDKAKKLFLEGSEEITSLGLKNKLYLAKIYQQKNETSKALEIYQELILSDSNIAKIALVDKAFIFKNAENYSRAIKLFREALRKGVSSAEIRFALGFCLEAIQEPEKALTEYFELIYSYPSEISLKIRAYFRIANIYQGKNNLDQAKNAYQKIIGLGVQESRIAEERLKEIINNQ